MLIQIIKIKNNYSKNKIITKIKTIIELIITSNLNEFIIIVSEHKNIMCFYTKIFFV